MICTSPPGGISHVSCAMYRISALCWAVTPCYPFPVSFATLSGGIDYAESLKIIVS